MSEEKKKRIVVRQAKPYDAVQICRLLEQALDGKEGLYPPHEEHRALMWVSGVLHDGYVVVAQAGNRLLGTVAVTPYQFPWSAEWYLYIDWIFVSRRYRQGGVFDALVTAMHAFADSRQHPAPIFGGISSGIDARLKDRLMQTKGYTYLGGQFLRPAVVESPEVAEETDGRTEENNHADVPA